MGHVIECITNHSSLHAKCACWTLRTKRAAPLKSALCFFKGIIMNKIFLIIFTFYTLLGCSSIDVRGNDEPHKNTVFPATKNDISLITQKNNIVLGELKYIFILDIPFSIITDILLLPYDAVMIMLSDDDNLENNNKK